MLTFSERRKKVFTIVGNPEASKASKGLAQHIIRGMEACAAEIATCFTEEGGRSGHTCLNPVIKPVGDSCNLRCTYCFNNPGHRVRVMENSVLEKLVAESLALSPSEIFFTIHGGEPLLAGVDFFERLIGYQQKYALPGQIIRNGVTTNGTLLNEEWCELFIKHKFAVAVSIDGPANVHDRYRKYADGRGSHSKVISGLSAARNAGLDIEVLMVIAEIPGITPRELLDFIISLGTRRARFNFCRSIASIESYPQFIVELFELWCEQETPLSIAGIEEVIRGLLGYGGRDCWMTGGCSLNISFDPDGTVAPCCEASIDKRFHFGNVLDESLQSILTGEKAKAFWRERLEGDDHCIGCEWRELCGGGCTFQRLQKGGTPANKDYLCGLYKNLFTLMAERMDYLLSSGSAASGAARFSHEMLSPRYKQVS